MSVFNMKGNRMIIFDDEDWNLSEADKELARRSILAVLDEVDFEYEVEVSLTTLNNDMIREINQEHRDMDKATDVLSFPMIDWPHPLDYTYMEGVFDSVVNPESESVLLGDIVLSMEKVVEQAADYGHSVEREFSFLIVHSMLHLLGFDHMTKDDEAQMIRWQKTIMKRIGL